MDDFFNYAKLDLSVSGNYEFNYGMYGMDYLVYMTNNLNSEIVTTSIYHKYYNSTDAFNGTKNFFFTKILLSLTTL